MKIKLTSLESYISAEEAALCLGVTRQRIYQLIEAGVLNARLVSETILIVETESVKRHPKYISAFAKSKNMLKLICLSDADWKGYLTVGKIYDGINEGEDYRVKIDNGDTHRIKRDCFKEIGKVLKVRLRKEYEFQFNAMLSVDKVYEATLAPDDQADVKVKPEGGRTFRIKTKYLKAEDSS